MSRELGMRLYKTSVKEDLNVASVFQHLAENYVNKVKSFNEEPSHHRGPQQQKQQLIQIGASATSRPYNHITVGGHIRTNYSNHRNYIYNNYAGNNVYPRNRYNHHNNILTNGSMNTTKRFNYHHHQPSLSSYLSPSNNNENRQTKSQTSKGFSPQDYLNNPMFDSLNNSHRHRYWGSSHYDRSTITLRPFNVGSSKKTSFQKKLPLTNCKVI